MQKIKHKDTEINLSPLTVTSQKAKAEAEIRKVLESVPENQAKDSKVTGALSRRYFEAEDLALRAIQDHYQEVLNRQVNIGLDLGIDAAFTKDGKLHIVEVKYSYHRRDINYVRSAVNQVVQAIENRNWKSVKLVLVLVHEDLSNTKLSSRDLEQILKEQTVPVEIIQYDINDLQRKFGVPSASA